ncbi:porin [Shigella flexneri]
MYVLVSKAKLRLRPAHRLRPVGRSDPGNTSEDNKELLARVAFAGREFQDVGSFDDGRNDGVVYDVTSWTDVLPEFGGDTYGSDNFMQQRGNGDVTYRNTDFFGLVDGLNFAVQYQGKNGSVRRRHDQRSWCLRQNGDGPADSITYDYEGFGIGAAVSSSNVPMIRLRPNGYGERYLGTGDRAETYTGGLKYDANNIYLAAQYTQTYNATRVGFWVGRTKHRTSSCRSVPVRFGCVHVEYLQSKGKNRASSLVVTTTTKIS